MTFTLTTPLYYVNDKPHLGSTYTTIACDALARFMRLQGEDVIFITGVDEHGQKIQRTAESNNVSPQEHCDQTSIKYLDLWKLYQIRYDKFIRTTSQKHTNLVHQIYERVKQSDDIYMSRQKGWYCVGCEEYKDGIDTKDTKQCPIHKRDLEWRDEENLFFRLSKYQTQIEELVNTDNFIYPRARQNEIINFVNKGLKDFSISRINLTWGIPVPDHKDHTFYVWFDALLGYLSALYNKDEEICINSIEQFGWPASLHVIGKDILRFHAIYWPAILLSANLPLPSKLFGHGFLTLEGEKMGKSTGNTIDPIDLFSNYGNDAIRWYLLKDIKFGSDGDFQHKRFIDIINNDLSNTIGNLLNRTSSMTRKWFNNKIPKEITQTSNSHPIRSKAEDTISTYLEAIPELNFQLAAQSILELATFSNIHLNEIAPWKLIKQPGNEENVALELYSVLEAIRIVGMLLNPLVPELSNRILSQLGEVNPKQWSNYLVWGILKPGSDLPEPNPVIPKIE